MKDILYFPYRLASRIEDLWQNTFAFFQRGKRGYADKDIWDFDYYLAEVISGGLKILLENHTAYPGELTPEEWDKILAEMIEGFENRLVEEEKDFDKSKLDKALELFKKYFLCLWD